jgi:molecular chaperone GrpE
MEKLMEQEKNKKKDQEKEQGQDNAAKDPKDMDAGETMVALTYDEYDALEKEIESLKTELEDQKDSYLRAHADFDNYKKRVNRDAARSYQDAMSSVLKIFLSVSDDIERALKNPPKENEISSWINGIELIHQKLMGQMKNQGVERMNVKPGDQFDPNMHEAITQEEHPEYEDGQIIDVVQPGYQISDRVIRPAMVRVAR